MARARMTTPELCQTDVSYDASHRLTSIADSESNRISFTLANGQLMAIQIATGAVTTLVRDQMNRITAIVDSFGNRASYTYNLNSQITAVKNPLGETGTLVYN